MAITRKPVPSPEREPEGPRFPGQLQRKDSWEVYSDDDDDNDAKPKPSSNPPPANPTYTPYAPPGTGASKTQTQYGMSHQYSGKPIHTGNHHDNIPEFLRPGGGKLQTNPFLRKMAAQTTGDTNPAPPSEQLSKLDLKDINPRSAQAIRSQTTSSSDYGTPPATSTSETNPWTGESTSHVYSPASETAVFPVNPREAIPESTYLQSPLQMESDPWVDAPVSTPKAPTLPPPPPPDAETNPWASSTPNTSKRPSPEPSKPPPAPPTFLAPPGPPPPQQHSARTPPPSFAQPPHPPPQNLSNSFSTQSYTAPEQAPIHVLKEQEDQATFLAPPGQPEAPISPQSSGYSANNPFNRQNAVSPQPLSSQAGSPALVSVMSDDESPWVDAAQERDDKAPQLPPLVGISSGTSTSESNVWEGLDSFDKPDKGKSKAVDSQIDEWKLVDVGEATDDAGGPVSAPKEPEQPPLPPRRDSAEASQVQWSSPRPPVDAKTETYQVKKIKWHDANCAQSPRTSPILVQNANGPCPLVALVNALCLTSPVDVNEASLVEVLRSREQISLNLLLEAVFEELMSPRRTDSEAALPDVGDLYAFLMSLHTGMNVNPRFVPTRAIQEAYERTSLTQLDAAERANLIPGTFENTHEMSLYATFKIPLIHGWLPEINSEALSSLRRQAQTYEDAQNLLFREQELDHKLSNTADGLSSDEQQLYQDIIIIKGFLSDSATQLTKWGIEVISKAIRPGTFAILFRNDHFSTLYCHPQTKELVTLVTDDGYRSHEEVVWESLVDISGQHTQYLAGDFKVVGSGSSSTFDGFSSSQGGGEWTTVQNRRGKNNEQPEEEAPISAREQEDRDLALALQLQEEEDQQHREEEARRQREQNLSSQYIEQQGRDRYGNIGSGSRAPGPVSPSGIAPARRSSHQSSTYGTSLSQSASRTSQPPQPQPQPQMQPQPMANSPQQPSRAPARQQQVRPLVPPRRYNPPATHRPEDGGADAPPTYEQAAHDEPFNPPPGHPNHATSTNQGQTPATPTAPTRPQPQMQGSQRFPGQSLPHRPHVAATMGRDRDRDCIVM